MNDGVFVINLEKHESIESLWIPLYANGNSLTHFDSFRVEYISKEIKKSIGNKIIKTGIYRIWANNQIMCGYFCIEFIDFMQKGKSLLDYNNLFSLNE